MPLVEELAARDLTGYSQRRRAWASDWARDERGGLFFAEHELPAELSTRRVLLPQLKRMFEHMRQPELPTAFRLEEGGSLRGDERRSSAVRRDWRVAPGNSPRDLSPELGVGHYGRIAVRLVLLGKMDFASGDNARPGLDE
jgi:hypothetical protein